MRYFILILFSIFIFTACQKSQSQNASADAKHYTLKGKIIAVDKAKKTATVQHGDVGDANGVYMPAMTMEFPVKDDWVWDDLTKDSEIRADLVVDKDSFWLEKIGIVAAPNPNQTPPPLREDVAQIGKEVPNFTLVNQDGKHISTKDFRGKALAITFVYTRCPLPNYCILMSKNFSDLANQLNANAEYKDKIRLLTVSFDPKYDTPAKLKEYGRGYLGNNPNTDFTVWQLATGTDKEIKSIADFFGLRYESDTADETQINHSLRTIVITPDGKVQKVFSGNEWSENDLFRELQATLIEFSKSS